MASDDRFDFCPICRKHVLEYRDAVLEREAMRKERDAAVEALSDRRDQQLEGFLEVEQANERLRAKVAELRAEVERLRTLLKRARVVVDLASYLTDQSKLLADIDSVLGEAADGQ